uniref:Uncharacterized protein n=1 Tax=Anguilla anguilla TaxID=7936 RepID=A0A0E9Q5Y4_ANGAN
MFLSVSLSPLSFTRSLHCVFQGDEISAPKGLLSGRFSTIDIICA